MVFCCFKLPTFQIVLHSPHRVRTRTPEPPLRPLPLHGIRRQLTGSDTNPIDATHVASAPAYNQQQSALIRRIPVEIRLIIWEYTLGCDADGDVLHLETANGSLRHCRCFEPDKSKFSFRHICWNSVWNQKQLDQGNWYSREPYDGRRKLQSLILTCKLLYREAIDIMYQCNTFSLHRAESILRMPQMMLPHRFQRIRSIEFSSVFLCPILPDTPCERNGKPPENASKWRAACKVLASLERLQSLEINVAIWSQTRSRRGVADDNSMVVLLEPLKAIRATRFSVILTQSLSEEVQKRLGPIPFTVSRRVRPGIGCYPGEEDD